MVGHGYSCKPIMTLAGEPCKELQRCSFCCDDRHSFLRRRPARNPTDPIMLAEGPRLRLLRPDPNRWVRERPKFNPQIKGGQVTALTCRSTALRRRAESTHVAVTAMPARYKKMTEAQMCWFEQKFCLASGKAIAPTEALLHNLGDCRCSPFTGWTYPTASVTGMPCAA